MSKKELKTNAMRLLDRLKIPYEYETYECDEFVSGVQTAEQIGLPHEQVYKTLVTTGKSGEHYVFVIPILVDTSLSLLDVYQIPRLFLSFSHSSSPNVRLFFIHMYPFRMNQIAYVIHFCPLIFRYINIE